jgi:hypothetical protein
MLYSKNLVKLYIVWLFTKNIGLIHWNGGSTFFFSSLLCSSTKKILDDTTLTLDCWVAVDMEHLTHRPCFMLIVLCLLSWCMDLVIVEEWVSSCFITFLLYDTYFQSITYSYFGFLHISWFLVRSSYFHG